MSKPLSQIYEDAAVDILKEETTFCCVALGWKSGGDEALLQFCALFRPHGKSDDHPWWSHEDYPEAQDFEEKVRMRQEARILALLLASEIARRARK